MSGFKTYMSFTDLVGVSEITEILCHFNIPFKVQDTSKDFDATFTVNNPGKDSILLMLKETDFKKASQLLDQQMVLNLDTINNNHPLFSFSNNELIEVVKNYDEWHPIDVKLAKNLLVKNGITVSDNEINHEQETKKKLSFKQEKSNITTLIMGYSFCLMGGLAGIGIALFMLTAKRTLPNGKKQFVYNKKDRKHAIYMLLSGGVVFLYVILKYNQ